LFNLPRIIKYKKGRVVERRGELQRLQGYLREVLADADPPLLPGIPGYQLLQRDLNTLEGHSLKQHEDLLDAYFCVYLALFLWRWGAERNEIIGDMATGYIVNPTSSVARAAQRVATGAEG
jgi:predicted RNase H-like nuclease